MASSRCTTIQCTFDAVPLVKDYDDFLVTLMDGICKQLREQLRKRSPRPEDFENEVRFAWSALPHEDRLGQAHYAILIIGPHEVEPVREVVDEIRASFREHRFDGRIAVLPL